MASSSVIDVALRLAPRQEFHLRLDAFYLWPLRHVLEWVLAVSHRR